MHKLRANLAVVAQRAVANGFTGQHAHVLAPVTGPIPRYVGRKSRRPGSDKGQGMWRTVSPNYRTMVTVDARWSA